MDLLEFIQIHQKSNTLNYIKPGFQKSQFSTSMNEIANLMKLILAKLFSDPDRAKRTYNYLQSGGLPMNLGTSSKNDASKKQSFCTEFSTMVSNIVGLLGFELSKYLMVIFGIKHFIKLVLDEISNCTSYEEIGVYVNYIRNMFLLGASNETESNPITLDSTFDISKYSHMMTSNISSRGINYFNSNTNSNTEDSILQWILKYIDCHVKNENIISFNDDKRLFCDIIYDMYNHIKLNCYEVSDVNELIINLGRFNVCYDKSFIKMFELLYKEGFTDIPYDIQRDYKPHVIYVENDLGLDVKCDKYTIALNKYFRDVYDNTLKSVIEILPNDYLNVNIQDSVYETLSDITLNLFVVMCRKIYDNQSHGDAVGKSTRIQFMQMLHAFMDSIPRYYTATVPQQIIIHYVLLSDKTIEDSIENANKNLNSDSDDNNHYHDDTDKKPKKSETTPKRSTRGRRKVVVSSSSSSDDDSSSEEPPKPPPRRGRRSVKD